jgi:hypothetical protein
MEISRKGVAIAAGSGVVLLLLCIGTLVWLSNQGPVLKRSEEKDPLSGTPRSVVFNPLRDRSAEKAALPLIRAMHDGRCREALADWEKDYRKKYASYICDSEEKHPLVSWRLVDWEDRPPLIILHYMGERRYAPDQPGTYREHFWITLENRGGTLAVTKYDAMY